jgi:signal transduction histidine kinase
MEYKLLLYRLAQESLHNIVKHAQAHQVSVELVWQEDQIYLTIHDDGKGFDTTIPAQGLGLRSMQERITQVEGELKVSSKPGEGTIISAQIPLK